jgi:hypothetical protein
VFFLQAHRLVLQPVLQLQVPGLETRFGAGATFSLASTFSFFLFNTLEVSFEKSSVALGFLIIR